MKRKKLGFIVTANMLIFILLLSACGGGNSGNTGGSGQQQSATGSQTTPTPKPAAPMKLEYALGGANLPKPELDFVKQQIDEALNVDFNITVYPTNGDQATAVNTRLASGDPPDFFIVYSRGEMLSYVDKGLIMDLTPYLDKLKPTIDFVGENNLKKAEKDGKIYAVVKRPEIPSGQLTMLWVRKDWLDNLGLSMPTNLDELMDTAKAFTENDPDGNNKKDTYGLTGIGLSTFEQIFAAYGLPGPTAFYADADGSMAHGAFDPRTKDALAYIQQMIDAGYVDSELLTNTGYMHQEKAIQGKAGIIRLNWAYMKKPTELAKFLAVDPKAEWVEIPSLSGPGGAGGVPLDQGRSNGFIMIPKSVEKDPDKLDKIFELLNYLSTDEGNRLVSYGVEGRHYNLEGDKVVPTDLMDSEAGYTWAYQITGVDEIPYLMTKFSELSPYIQFAYDQTKMYYYNSFAIPPEGFNVADSNRFYEEELIKILYGKTGIDKYDDILKTLDDTFKHNVYREAAESQLRSLGLVK